MWLRSFSEGLRSTAPAEVKERARKRDVAWWKLQLVFDAAKTEQEHVAFESASVWAARVDDEYVRVGAAVALDERGQRVQQRRLPGAGAA